jgi:hypothetical protein
MTIKQYDVVALIEDTPELPRGHVGAVIEVWDENNGIFEVEFTDYRNGTTYAMLTLRRDQLMVLHYSPKETPDR